jgi:RNA-binding protein
MISKDKQALRAAAHALKPVVLLGAKGLTDAVVQEIDIALTAHELIKVKLTGVEKEEKLPLLEGLCERLRADLIQHIGHIAVLYRENIE